MLAYLHTHTDYSALDGMSRPIDVLRRAKELGAEAVSINDHGTVAGHIDFLNSAREVGIKPILGYEGYEWNPNYHEDRRHRWHCNFFARTEEGMHNLWKLASLAWRDSGEGHRKQDSYEEHYRECGRGIIASSACLGGAMSQFAQADDRESAEWYANRMLELFDDFYIEIHTNREPEQPAVNKWLMEFAIEHNLKTIYAIDSHYANPQDVTTHETWLGAQTHSTFDTVGKFEMQGDYYLQPESDIRNRLAYLGSEWVERCFDGVAELVGSIETDYPIDKSTKVPRFGADDAAALLKEQCLEGLMTKVVHAEKNEAGEWRIPPHVKVADVKPYIDRLFDEEFPVILDNGLSDYFLIVGDYVRKAKDVMLVGPGRGSGAGSLVNYLLSITTIDPLRFDLPFARFLNAGRVESGAMPDVDVDFQDDMKEWVGGYLADTYGDEHVARIGSVLTMKLKSAIKKCCTYWKVPFQEANAITKVVGEMPGISPAEGDEYMWDRAWSEASEDVKSRLQPYIDKYPQVFRDAIRIQGLVSTYGKHASAYVVSPIPISDYLPVRKTHDGDVDHIVTQWDGRTVESLGFLKVDILGLRTLSTIGAALSLIKERRGEDIDIYSLEVGDGDPMWDMLSRGDTLGCFQLETRGITNVIRTMKPRSVNDLGAAVALYRPGVIDAGQLDVYLNRRTGREKVSYLHPDLEPIVGETCGVMVYQEQVMRICVELAGYTMVEADNIRKIMGKKQIEKLPAEREKFIKRASDNGYPLDMLNELWRQMEASGRYSFNKSHAISYGTVAMWTAWLKCHYPTEFLCACMVTNTGDVPEYIREARKFDVRVTPPDVSRSGMNFTVIDDHTISFGLVAVKGVGEKAAEAITSCQPFSDLDDFMDRVPRKCNAGHRRALAKVGAFSSLTDMTPDEVMRDVLGEESPSGWSESDIVREENELLGLCVSIDRFAAPLSQLGEMSASLKDRFDLEEAKYGSANIVLAEVQEAKMRKTRNGKDMSFLTLYLQDGSPVEAVAFGRAATAIGKMGDLAIGLFELEKGMRGSETSWKVRNVMPYGKE